ncbi:MAG: S8 family serine peptidase [Paracoccaceae bacterium]
MVDWKPYSSMFGSTPYSDWRITAKVEEYFRGAEFNTEALVRAIRYIDANETGTEGFFEALRTVGYHMSEHFGEEAGKNLAGSIIAYVDPTVDFTNLGPGIQATKPPQIEYGPLVDKEILRPRPTQRRKDPDQPSFTKKSWAAEDTICAIIDDTIGFANARFRTELTKTRIEALWIMDGKCKTPVNSQFEVFGGTILFREDIDALLEEFFSDGAVDEAALYAYIDVTFDTAFSTAGSDTHGTHVLDLFAGSEMGSTTVQCGERPIIAVILPQLAVRDSSGTHSEFFVQEAVAWINTLADAFPPQAGNAPPQLVTNFSFGLLAGPHDGQSNLEKGLATIPERGRSAAVLPAGNSYEARTHAVAELAPNAPSASLKIELSPQNRLSTFVEIWCSPGAPCGFPKLTLALETPWGDVVETNPKFGSGYEWCPNGYMTMRTYHLSAPCCDEGSLSREMAMVAILPTYTTYETLPLAPSGIWTLTVTLESDHDETLDLWIQRGGSVFGHPRLGEQSRFMTHETAIRSLGTLNALATAEKVVSVGGYIHSGDCDPAPYTSAGDPAWEQSLPDVSAPSDQSHSVAGIVASGTYSGSFATLSGTSVAAPQVARLLADFDFGDDSKGFVQRLAETVEDVGENRFRLGQGRLFKP